MNGFFNYLLFGCFGAQTADAAAEGSSGGTQWWVIIIYIVIFAAFIYFLMIRPQRKQKKEQEARMGGMEPGDSVLTTSGFYGTIVAINGDTVIVEFGNNKNCRIPMAKQAISQVEKANAAATVAAAPVAQEGGRKKFFGRKKAEETPVEAPVEAPAEPEAPAVESTSSSSEPSTDGPKDAE